MAEENSFLPFPKASTVLWKGSAGFLFILQGSYPVPVIIDIKLKLEAAADPNAKALMETCKWNLRNVLLLYIGATLF